MKLRINEKETPNIEVKHEGILEVPEGKEVNELPYSHFEKLAKKKGLSKITKALNNLQVWNKNDDKELSKWAGNMIDKLNDKLKKDESLTFKEKSMSYVRTVANGDLYTCPICGNQVFYDDMLGFYCDECGEQFEDETIEELQLEENFNEDLTKDNKSYWKYNLDDKIIQEMEDNWDYFDKLTIRKIKIYPCKTVDECYDGDFSWPVSKYEYPHDPVFGTEDEAYEELMYDINNRFYEQRNDL